MKNQIYFQFAVADENGNETISLGQTLMRTIDDQNYWVVGDGNLSGRATSADAALLAYLAKRLACEQDLVQSLSSVQR